MSNNLVLTTELEAVNIILQGIGEQPVNTLPAEGISEASEALSTLHRTSRQVQGEGLHCNTETDYPLVPDSSGNIAVPPNALEVDPCLRSKDYVRRGTKLYDKEEHTFVFTDTIKVNIIFFLEFTDLPQHVRNYITVKAARIFQKNVIGSSELHGFSSEDESYARAVLKRHELNQSDHTMLDNVEVAKVLRRWR